ncbi:TrbG/VirB9 family P-type conjugative transfer protein [Roseitranquillus sediminis]|uniref:TrbG/VirB9 family P-type conjugative transfer protein n=1 Tax=Roseitranquillus sediminis TaxID=2809051 RepID=UPI001D0C8F06|nr:TrbG/VirB9 family P-type conjugative transfer protein [Roseitranquillus sediminis]MBM9595055.1 TrbG/VirB9 family P-type conjugative transfer protein [Roseitranquillus sediminis]
MRPAPAVFALALLASVTTAAAETKPRPFPEDPRIRSYVYDEHEVYRLDTYLRFITAIEFAAGENIESVQVGDSESWQIVRLNRGDVLSIKPLIDGAYTNMTVYTDRRAYTFELRARQGQVGSPNLNYRVSFTYPEEEAARRRKAAERALRPRDYDYHAAGKAASIRPIQVYDDGRQTFFVFPEGARRPAIFAADASGRESVVNVTHDENASVVDRVSERWTLRIGDEELCIAHGRVVRAVRGGRSATPLQGGGVFK